MELQKERKERVASVKNACLRVELNKETKSSLVELPRVSVERDGDDLDFEGMSEKQLKPREIQIKLNVDESGVRIVDPIGEEEAKSEKNEKSLCFFIGEPIPEAEAQQRWQWRYDLKSRKKGKNWKINADEEDEIILNVESHYAQANIVNFLLNIGDCVFVKVMMLWIQVLSTACSNI